MEIERKWLVDKDRCPGLVVYDAEIRRTEQGYLNHTKDEYLIRVRKVQVMGTNKKPLSGEQTYYFLELKTQGLLSREELAYYISEKEYKDTLSKCRGVVKKTRYCWYGEDGKGEHGYYFEVDVYDNHDFVTCEVEFNSEEEANNFEAPDWCLEDVTYDPAYKNINLVK